MIKKCLLVAYILYSSPIFTQVIEDPFAVVLMVKNEELKIRDTLAPFVEAGIHSYLIFDTGSTDKTVETAEDFFKDNAVTGYHIFQEPFIDFDVSRNRALDLAEECFPDITFLLFPDAEWYMHNVEGLKNFCNDNIHDNCKCYLVRVCNPNIDFPQARLIRSKTNSRFVDDIHEIITDVEKWVPRDIFFELGVSETGLEKSRKRWESDLQKLLKRYEKDPNNARTVFYVGQTYECLCDFEQAYTYYEIRTRMQNGAYEETYETFYRLGRVTDILSKINERYTWHMAQDYYFIAHKMMPHRAEPLLKIAYHYWPDSSGPENAALCYLFAKRAYELPYPENDFLFVDPQAYHFWRYELLSKSAWHVGDFELGEICTRKALEYNELPHLLRNLACYLEMNQR